MGVLEQLPLLPIVCSVAVYFASLGFYRLFLHPLAHFPGPKLAALTGLYEAYYDVVCNGQYTFQIAKLHKKYGPIIRISPYELHIDEPAYYEKLYKQDGKWEKYAWSYDAFGAKFSTICTIDHDLHRLRRAALNPYFSKAAVAKQEDMIQRLVERLCDRIGEWADTKQTANLTTAVGAFTRDVATEFVLGKSYDHLGHDDFNADITNVLQSSGGMWRMTKHIRFLSPIMKALPLDFVAKTGDEGTKGFFEFLIDMRRITKDIIRAESAAPTPKTGAGDLPRNIVHEILESALPLNEKTFERINDDVGTVTGAAFETTAQTLRTLLYYIYSQPKVLTRLRVELAEARQKNSGRLPLAVLERLSYLTAVLTEGLRLSPGLATRLARIAPDRDLAFGDWRIPKGTPVGMTVLLMHFDERAFVDAARFNPDRWMDAETRRASEKVFAPFSRGTRICLGMHLAWAELYLVIAGIIQRFDFQLDGAGPKDVEPDSDQFIIGTKDKTGIRAFVSKAN